ncbi:MAG: hypothetical protein ACJ8ER_05355 [Allosphingosinicella sp.]
MESDRSNARPRRIDAAAKAKFLAALRRGARLLVAAREAGFSLAGFYMARHKDPAFAADWVEALAASVAEGRRSRARPAYRTGPKGSSGDS